MLRTLIVEDNDHFRQTLLDSLSYRFPEMEIASVEDGVEALDSIETLQPDVILMDVHLPGEDNGLVLTKKIKEKYADITIVVLTSYDLPEYRDAAFKNGANYFFPKSTASEDIAKFFTDILLESSPQG